MILDKNEGELKEILQKQAEHLFGGERAGELASTLQQLASSIAAISKFEIPLEEEPAFLVRLGD